MTDPKSPLMPHGGYRNLRAYKVAEAVYDATVVFCNRLIDKRSRTHDQMVQAARSGVRNISEGSGAAATSKKSEMLLTNVARASLSDELIKDYESYLLQNGLRLWSKDSREALAMRERLKHDVAPNLPPASAEKVRLTGLAGLSSFVVEKCANERQEKARGREKNSGVVPPIRRAGALWTSKKRESDRSDLSDRSDFFLFP